MFVQPWRVETSLGEAGGVEMREGRRKAEAIGPAHDCVWQDEWSLVPKESGKFWGGASL